jgi:hypothetical protein
MTPRRPLILPLDKGNSTIRSKYWNDKNDTSMRPESTWHKRQYRQTQSTDQESLRPDSQSPNSARRGPADRQHFKRTYEDAFDFKPKETVNVKEEPQDESSTSKPATLMQHFIASKAFKPSTSAMTRKDAFFGRKSTEPTQLLDIHSMKESQERFAIVAALAFVRDSAVTDAVVAHVLRWARQHVTSGNGDVYDTGLMQSIFTDLDALGVEPDRRAVVTEMLTRPLQQQLESLRTSSESLRSCLASINTPQPSSPLS